MKAVTHLLAAFLGLAVGALLLGSPASKRAATQPPTHVSFQPPHDADPGLVLGVMGYKRYDRSNNLIDAMPVPDPTARTWNIQVTDETGYYVLRCGLSASDRTVRTVLSAEQ